MTILYELYDDKPKNISHLVQDTSSSSTTTSLDSKEEIENGKRRVEVPTSRQLTNKWLFHLEEIKINKKEINRRNRKWEKRVEVPTSRQLTNKWLFHLVHWIYAKYQQVNLFTNQKHLFWLVISSTWIAWTRPKQTQGLHKNVEYF